MKDVCLFLAYQTQKDFPRASRPKCDAAIYNLLKSLFILVPIVNTIFACVMIALIAIAKRKGAFDPHLKEKIFQISFCIVGLGFLLLPFMITGTYLSQLTNKKIREIPPDYLL